MNILLINPPYSSEDFLGPAKKLSPQHEPLGLLYLAAVCERAHHRVTVVDAIAEGLTLKQIEELISAEKPDLIGLSVLIASGASTLELGRWIKKEYPKLPVVLGNLHASIFAETYLKSSSCDVVVHGEGEHVFLALVEHYEKKKTELSHIPAISFLDGDKVVTTSRAAIVQDLSALPFPSRHLIDSTKYAGMIPYSNASRIKVAKHMFTARGCVYSCRFCVAANEDKKAGVRCNSLENVVREMEILINDYHADYIFIYDPNFIVNKQRVLAICRLMKEKGLRVRWGCEGHVNFSDRELFQEMESAGCVDIAFGIESGVQRIVDNVQKGFSLERAEQAVRLVKQCTKMTVIGLFMLGLPGETAQDIQETIRFSKRVPFDYAAFSICVPYPGTPLFYELRKEGKIHTGVNADGSVDPAVWSLYTPYSSLLGKKPIWVTPGLTADDLMKLHRKAFMEFYLRPKQIWSRLRTLRISQIGATIKVLLRALS